MEKYLLTHWCGWHSFDYTKYNTLDEAYKAVEKWKKYYKNDTDDFFYSIYELVESNEEEKEMES